MEVSLDDRSSSHISRAQAPEPAPPPAPTPLENTARVQENSQRFTEQLNSGSTISLQNNSGIPFIASGVVDDPRGGVVDDPRLTELNQLNESRRKQFADRGTPYAGDLDLDGNIRLGTGGTGSGNEPSALAPDNDFSDRNNSTPYLGDKDRHGEIIPGTGGLGSGNEQSAISPQLVAPFFDAPGSGNEDSARAPEIGRQASPGEPVRRGEPGATPIAGEAGAAPSLVFDPQTQSHYLQSGHGQEGEQVKPLPPFGLAHPPFFGDKPKIAVIDGFYGQPEQDHGERVADVIEAYTGDRADIDRFNSIDYLKLYRSEYGIQKVRDERKLFDGVLASQEKYDYVNLSFHQGMEYVMHAAEAYNAHQSNQNNEKIDTSPGSSNHWSADEQKQLAEFIMGYKNTLLPDMDSDFSREQRRSLRILSKQFSDIKELMDRGTKLFIGTGNINASRDDVGNAFALMKHFNQESPGSITMVGGTQGIIGGVANTERFGTRFGTDVVYPTRMTADVFGVNKAEDKGTSFATPLAIVHDIFGRVGEEVVLLDDAQRAKALDPHFYSAINP